MLRFIMSIFSEYWRSRRSSSRGVTEGSAILEFAIALPLLVVFVVGIYDFSAAFNQKQKIEQAAQEGAIIAGGQPTSDISVGNPPSLQPVAPAVFTSLVGSGVLAQANQGNCKLPPPAPSTSGLTWTYTFSRMFRLSQ